MLWAMILGQILRDSSFHALESLVRSGRRRRLAVAHQFGNDALGYFTERLDPTPTRRAAIQIARQAKRNKAFQNSAFLGLALDGTTAGRSQQKRCDLCRPWRHSGSDEIAGYRHHLVMLSVVGTGLSLPIDVEPYGPKDSEYAAGQRLLRRIMPQLGPRFADYLVVDGEYATAPFLHVCEDVGLPVVARLKGNLPELFHSTQKRFSQQPAKFSLRFARDRVQVWDADDFDPWENLRWSTVRVLYYRQHKPDGSLIEAYWLTNLSPKRISTRSLFRMAKSRWEIAVSRKGHINQSVKDRPRPKDSGLVAREVSWRESKTTEPSDNIFRKEYAQLTRLQRTVNADVASSHVNPVAETVDNARRQQELAEMSPMRRLSPAGYQRRHGEKEDVSTGEALGARRRNLAEEATAITASGKCRSRYQGDGSGRSTVDGRAAKHVRREGPGPVTTPFVQGEAGVR